MRRVSPEEFRDAFTAVVQHTATELHDQWMQHNDPAFTSFVRERLIPPIAARLELLAHCKGDYLGFDAVLYAEKDTSHFKANETWVKALAVAIEHENQGGNGTYREMIKLQLLNTPLKVLIAYAREREIAKLLKGYTEIIEAADTFKDFTSLRRQLVIFGDVDANGRRWTFHAYERSGFAVLPELLLPS